MSINPFPTYQNNFFYTGSRNTEYNDILPAATRRPQSADPYRGELNRRVGSSERSFNGASDPFAKNAIVNGFVKAHPIVNLVGIGDRLRNTVQRPYFHYKPIGSGGEEQGPEIGGVLSQNYFDVISSSGRRNLHQPSPPGRQKGPTALSQYRRPNAQSSTRNSPDAAALPGEVCFDNALAQKTYERNRPRMNGDTKNGHEEMLMSSSDVACHEEVIIPYQRPAKAAAAAKFSRYHMYVPKGEPRAQRSKRQHRVDKTNNSRPTFNHRTCDCCNGQHEEGKNPALRPQRPKSAAEKKRRPAPPPKRMDTTRHTEMKYPTNEEYGRLDAPRAEEVYGTEDTASTPRSSVVSASARQPDIYEMVQELRDYFTISNNNTQEQLTKVGDLVTKAVTRELDRRNLYGGYGAHTPDELGEHDRSLTEYDEESTGDESESIRTSSVDTTSSSERLVEVTSGTSKPLFSHIPVGEVSPKRNEQDDSESMAYIEQTHNTRAPSLNGGTGVLSNRGNSSTHNTTWVIPDSTSSSVMDPVDHTANEEEDYLRLAREIAEFNALIVREQVAREDLEMDELEERREMERIEVELQQVTGRKEIEEEERSQMSRLFHVLYKNFIDFFHLQLMFEKGCSSLEREEEQERHALRESFLREAQLILKEEMNRRNTRERELRELLERRFAQETEYVVAEETRWRRDIGTTESFLRYGVIFNEWTVLLEQQGRNRVAEEEHKNRAEIETQFELAEFPKPSPIEILVPTVTSIGHDISDGVVLIRPVQTTQEEEESESSSAPSKEEEEEEKVEEAPVPADTTEVNDGIAAQMKVSMRNALFQMNMEEENERQQTLLMESCQRNMLLQKITCEMDILCTKISINVSSRTASKRISNTHSSASSDDTPSDPPDVKPPAKKPGQAMSLNIVELRDGSTDMILNYMNSPLAANRLSSEKASLHDSGEEQKVDIQAHTDTTVNDETVEDKSSEPPGTPKTDTEMNNTQGDEFSATMEENHDEKEGSAVDTTLPHTETTEPEESSATTQQPSPDGGVGMYPPPGNVPLDIPFGVDFMESPSEMKRPLKLSEVANAQKKLNAIERHNRHAQQQSNFAAPPQTNLEKTRSRLSDGSFLETPNFENKKTMPYASSLKLANPTGSQSSGSENGFPEGTSPKAANAVRPKRGSTKRKVAPLVISTVEEDETGELKEHDTDLLWKNQPRSPVERKRQATTQKEDGTEENANELVQDLLEYPPTPPTPAITSMENVPEEELKRRHNAAGMTPVLTKNVEMKEITELKLSSSKSSNDDGETRAAQPAPKARMTSIALMLRCVTPPGEESTTDSPTISHTNSQTFTGNDDGNPSNGKTSLPKSWKISKRTPGKFDREEAARYRREVEMEELQIDKEVKELNSVPSFMERIARPFPPIPDTPSPSSSAGNSDMTDFKKVKLPRAGGTSSDDSISSS